MIVAVVYTFIVTIFLGSVAEATLMRSIPIPIEVNDEFEALSRYCGSNYGYSGYNNYYSGYNNYYRPTSYTSGGSSGLSNLLGPAIFGLAAVGGGAALAGLIGQLSGAGATAAPTFPPRVASK